MKFTIKYLVSVRDRTGKREEELDFPEGSMHTLNGKGWSQYPEKMSTPLHEGDTICIFSRISGG
jgi:molybdopterin converting factor small subunit